MCVSVECCIEELPETPLPRTQRNKIKQDQTQNKATNNKKKKKKPAAATETVSFLARL